MKKLLSYIKSFFNNLPKPKIISEEKQKAIKQSRLKKISDGLIDSKYPLKKTIVKDCAEKFYGLECIVFSKFEHNSARYRIIMEEKTKVPGLVFLEILKQLNDLKEVIKEVEPYVVLNKCNDHPNEDIKWSAYLLEEISSAKREIEALSKRNDTSFDRLREADEVISILCGDAGGNENSFTLLEEVGRQLREVVKTQKTS
ncbi:MAG: hypothetical protein KAS07_00170 [Candidatus Pacebacteria bacterium]|nr:hypothetical protein [Candidatus Paceibacterota bacterium]